LTGSGPWTVTAGSSFKLSLVLSTGIGPQQGVPVTFYIAANPITSSYTGTFSGGLTKITVLTDSTGTASTTVTADTLATDSAVFIAQVAQPLNGNAANMLANSTASLGVTTVSGAPAQFVLKVYFDNAKVSSVKSNAVNGSTLFVNVLLSDAFGNAAINSLGEQVQVLVTTSTGLLSITSAYVNATTYDTWTSMGPIAWTLPSSIGTPVVLTASGVYAGVAFTTSKTVTTVSAIPSISVTSPLPLSGVIYSNSPNTMFQGQANASLGYPSSVNIVSVGYSTDGGAWQSAVVAPGNKIVWSVLTVLSAGLHTVAFNATDAYGNTVVSSTYTLLIETAAPTITITTANGATLNAGTGLTATIVDTMGDLNFTSVMATYNGTALPASAITITGTNNPGVNTTYLVTVSGLPAGTWTVTLSASSLAGNAAIPQSITVTVFVSTNQYFTLLGTPSQITIGGFPAVNATFTNNLNIVQTGIVFAVVKNSLGQTIYYTTSTISPAAGASASAILVLAGLAHGTYSVNIFVVSPTNVAVSTSTTVSVTI
jgi:hypothetical protein